MAPTTDIPWGVPGAELDPYTEPAMPVYEYVCMKCEAHFEKLRRVSDADPACPSCGAERVRRQLSVFAAGSSTSAGEAGGGLARGGGTCGCGGACACGH